MSNITAEMSTTLINAYNSNKDTLSDMQKTLDEGNCLDNGLTNIDETFEMGYNNALEFVFQTLNITINN